jgi:hypothetical protein
LHRAHPLPNPPPSRGRACISTPICTPAPSMGAGRGGGDARRVRRLGSKTALAQVTGCGRRACAFR